MQGGAVTTIDSPPRERELLRALEAVRREAAARLDPRRQSRLGQFLTPGPLAAFLAGMFGEAPARVRILDPGAGTGALSAALVAELCQRRPLPAEIALTAYEIDPLLAEYLGRTLGRCRTACEACGLAFRGRIVAEDFLDAGARSLSGDLFAPPDAERYDFAILNPPYRKIGSQSHERQVLRGLGVETSNLYAGFVAVAARLLAPGGEMVAITPRSFCNGPYFEPFRHDFLRRMRFRRIHVFDARDTAFAEDQVLQENVVFHAVKCADAASDATVSASGGPGEGAVRQRTIPHAELVRPDDPRAVIHLAPDGESESVRRRITRLPARLADLGLAVSTGRVVSFRVRERLRMRPAPDAAALIHPCHFRQGFIEWPTEQTRKPNALALGPGSEDLLAPAGCYVLTKRFSAKEERRRIVAAVYDPARLPAGPPAFENHLNYFHAGGGGLPVMLAKGLAAYLNSTPVDSFFRQFSGHTQVNAADLRALPYPPRSALVALGRRIAQSFPPQDELDRLVEEIV